MNNHQKTRRRLVAATAASVAWLPMLRAARAADLSFSGVQLVSSGFGGATQDTIQHLAFDPFDARTHAQTVQVPLQSDAALARMKAEAAHPQIDMFQFSGGQELQAKSLGLTHTLDQVTQLGNLPASMKDADSQWVTWSVIAEGILYRTDKIATPPTSYRDLFDPKYKGHVAFPAITNGYGMDFLVMLARTFGGGEHNIDPGFKALAQLKNETIFQAASDLPTLFSQGDIWIMPYDASNAFKLQKAGLPVAFAVPKEGSPAVPCTAVVAKNSKNVAAAQAAIDALLQPDFQVALARELHWAPSNAKTVLPADLARTLPALSSLASLDRVTINQQHAQWVERWNREIAG